MTYRNLIFTISFLAATAALSLAYGLEQFWAGSIAALGLGVLSWYRFKKAESAWSPNLYLAGMVLLVALGGLLNLRAYLLVLAMLAAIGAWDLVRFHKRLAHSPDSESIPQIEKRHLSLLGLTLLIGGIMSGMMLTIQMQISFGITLALAVFLIITLGQILRMLRS